MELTLISASPRLTNGTSPLLSTKDAAAYLGLSASTLNKWRCFGTGPVFVKLGRAVRYRRTILDEFLSQKTACNTIY